ncbi:diacylglycerol/lipid kinase family protein [Halobacteriaceae archaeon GCM10025711]
MVGDGESHRDRSAAGPATDEERVLVLNPESGDGTDTDTARDLAAEYGFAVQETESRGDGVTLAREAAAAGASLVAAGGGDGTVNEVVAGVDEADALDRMTVGVVPLGTGNNFAGNLGLTGVEQSFEVLDAGERRRIDLGRADGRVFVNSCVGGLTAAASSETSSELKERFGVLAYVATTLRKLREYDDVRMTVETGGVDGPVEWHGEALALFVGNARRVGTERRSQADVEDGRFDVAVIETMPPRELLGEAALYRLFGAESEYVTRLQTPGLTARTSTPVEFSFDGEMATLDSLTATTLPGALETCVGEAYDPDPDLDPDDEG